MRERLIVVGGDAAGMSAASQARRLRDADELEIVAFERGRHTSYSACGIPYWIAGAVARVEQLVARTPETFRDAHAIDVHIRHEVVAIDTAEREVVVRDLDTGGERRHGYDQLMVATGGAPLRPSVPGIEEQGVFGVQTLDDGRAVLDALEERRPRRAVVIGAGYIGLEMAEAMQLRGLEVDLVDRADQPMSTIGAGFAARIAEAMRGMGIGMHLGTTVTGIDAGADGWVRAVLTSEATFEADLVVLGTGTRPFSDLARAAGIPIGPSGGVVADDRQHTPVAGVWTAGDCAETLHRISGRPVSIPLGTIANRQGRVAGLNLGGGSATFPGVLGTAVTKVCQLEIARTGLGEEEAGLAGFEVVTTTIESTTRASYYPDARPIAVEVIAERGTGRLLGAQILGEEGAAKRIDVFATALWNGMTAEELIDVDLSYAPPFSPVWDPVLIAARRAAAAVDAAHG